MGCTQSKPLECPKCGCAILSNREFLLHWEREHELTPRVSSSRSTPGKLSCPRCDKSGFSDVDKLVSHVEHVHFISNKAIMCPKCSHEGFTDGAALLRHCEKFHNNAAQKIIMVNSANNSQLPQVETVASAYSGNTMKPNQIGNRSLPQIGDKVLAMWVHTKWQYFHATICRFIPDELKYEINWDDQDTSGRIVDYFNLALDKSPNPGEISIGSIVLFPQGYYKGSQSGATEGVRWHQGRVTRIYTSADGTKMVDGCHTKGGVDGKWITYNGYKYTFEGLKLQDLRIGPNVFDILDDAADEDVIDDDIDIYFSYSMSDSPKAIKNREIDEPPKHYLPLLDKLCDPLDILDNLKQTGLNVAIRKTTNGKEMRRTAAMMKKAKLFIACISDQYVANNECRMEFQFAKSTLGKPIVPLVVGDSSFDWTMSVIGMLIAGELYIHFKDKSVEKAKLNELLLALKSHFENIAEIIDSGEAGSQVQGPADIFLSYCWTNSTIAKNVNQISTVVGNEYSDPRRVKAELEKAGFTVWLDIERLRSADANADMYQQLTNALKEAKAVIPFVSTEYANSPNCRMEFQFAMKSLERPILPVIVGEGDAWKVSVIGALVAANNNQPITLQDVASRGAWEERLEHISKELNRIMRVHTEVTANQMRMRYRAPRPGDHVVSHHKRCSYFMATIVSFDSSSLEYTVAWDDGDPSGKVQPYNQVALDVIPDPDDVGVGSIVFFPQGKYGATEGNNIGGQRYHEGLVTSCREYNGTKMIYGHHTRGEADGKWITYKGYSYEFKDCPLTEIRIAPSAMDALFAGKS